MTDSQLMALAKAFFKRAFSLEDAELQLGPRQDSDVPNKIVLSPRDPHVTWCKLEVVGEIAPGRPFVSGIILRFKTPIRANFQAWQEWLCAFPKVRPRLHPEQPIPYEFYVTVGELEGFIHLDVQAEPLPTHPPVVGAIFRRVPPDWPKR